MSSVCTGMDCLSCLKSGGFFVRLLNSTLCCVYNLANFDLQYSNEVGPDDHCPSFYSSWLNLGLVGVIGLLAGCGVGLFCYLQNRIFPRRFDEEITQAGADGEHACERENWIDDRNMSSEYQRRPATVSAPHVENTNRKLPALVAFNPQFQAIALNDDSIGNQNDENYSFERLHNWSVAPANVCRTRKVKSSESFEVFEMTAM